MIRDQLTRNQLNQLNPKIVSCKTFATPIIFCAIDTTKITLILFAILNINCLHRYFMMFHEVIAAAGGLLFIVFGLARQRERKQLITAGIKTEGPFLWEMFLISGSCLVLFAFGLIVYQLSK